jgi:2,3,4,5-tetrahydropyridine-2-carboxylate N-succinyltransferase
MIKTKEDFNLFTEEHWKNNDNKKPIAFAIGLANIDSNGNTLDTWYPFINFEENYGSAAVFQDYFLNKYNQEKSMFDFLEEYFTPFLQEKGHKNIDIFKNLLKIISKNNFKKIVYREIHNTNSTPIDVSDVYFRLHLLSHCLVKPNKINLDGAFGILSNNIWTNEGPISEEDFQQRKFDSLIRGDLLSVISKDKFPALLNYVIPKGVRIADGARVRLGAHLAPGTTIMHEGFVNFNAGTLGESMIEGRISAGVVIGNGSDLGGGCSTMGTLSGGGKEKISVGENCLIGAEAGIGISLGNNCTVEAGLYITAGTKVQIVGGTDDGAMFKASSLSGESDMLFRRNSISGTVEVLFKKNEVELNSELHNN